MTDSKFELHVPSTPGSEKLAMDFAADVARRRPSGIPARAQGPHDDNCA